MLIVNVGGRQVFLCEFRSLLIGFLFCFGGLLHPLLINFIIRKWWNPMEVAFLSYPEISLGLSQLRIEGVWRWTVHVLKGLLASRHLIESLARLDIFMELFDELQCDGHLYDLFEAHGEALLLYFFGYEG